MYFSYKSIRLLLPFTNETQHIRLIKYNEDAQNQNVYLDDGSQKVSHDDDDDDDDESESYVRPFLQIERVTSVLVICCECDKQFCFQSTT